MAQTTASDTTILELNGAIYDALSQYIDTSPDTGVSIVFDLPAVGSTPFEPTLSVFLYEIHEDLQMRTAQTRATVHDPQTGTVRISPGRVNVACNYIITYWDGTETQVSNPGSPGSAPDNQAITVMNQVVNALINNRELPGMPGAYTRMIPPKTELSSLGNFWQSLGNKPKLSLCLAVTVPVPLTDKGNTVPAVRETQADVTQRS
jgi:hypothetical protein